MRDDRRSASPAPARARRRRPRRRGAAEPVATRRSIPGWLAALKTLDFDQLSRNAQVDYLFIRRTAETQIARANLKLDPNPPRKTDDSGIPGPARGRDGLIQDLSEAMIPYTPEELIALAEKEFAWCDRGDDEGVARDGLRQRLEEGDREDQGHAPCRPAASRG